MSSLDILRQGSESLQSFMFSCEAWHIMSEDNLLHACQDTRVCAMNFCKVPTCTRRTNGVNSEHIIPLYRYPEGSVHDCNFRSRGPEGFFRL
jgi:hypothetical protein